MQDLTEVHPLDHARSWTVCHCRLVLTEMRPECKAPASLEMLLVVRLPWWRKQHVDCSSPSKSNVLIPLLFFLICSEFCHTLKWNSHGFTCVPHPDPPSHLPLHLLPLGLPSAPDLSACFMIQPGLVICFTLDNIHVSMLFSWNIPPLPSPTESKRLFYKSVSLFLFCI